MNAQPTACMPDGTPLRALLERGLAAISATARVISRHQQRRRPHGRRTRGLATSAEDKLCIFAATDRTCKFVFARLVPRTTGAAARLFLDEIVAVVPYCIHTSLPTMASVRRSAEEVLQSDCQMAWASIRPQLTKPNHPWTNDQVERMNRTIKEATAKRDQSPPLS